MDDDDPTSPHLVTTLLPSLDPLKAASGAANNCRSEAQSVNSQNTLVFFMFFLHSGFDVESGRVATGFYGGILLFFVFKIIRVDSPSKD